MCVLHDTWCSPSSPSVVYVGISKTVPSPAEVSEYGALSTEGRARTWPSAAHSRAAAWSMRTVEQESTDPDPSWTSSSSISRLQSKSQVGSAPFFIVKPTRRVVLLRLQHRTHPSLDDGSTSERRRQRLRLSHGFTRYNGTRYTRSLDIRLPLSSSSTPSS